ncbi:MAG: hypothetical protein KI792_07180 [Alphaproteobacteria bacterium]|nr:hypothetical protein [Alphaproteobacteria bacterium SS10]
MTWKDEDEIVRALEFHHPRITRIGLSDEAMDQLIRNLPGFVAGRGPDDPSIYQRLITKWIDLDEDEGDSQWDAYT